MIFIVPPTLELVNVIAHNIEEWRGRVVSVPLDNHQLSQKCHPA
jgi:hypothetical protein